MGGSVGSLHTTALVHSHVDDHGTGLHQLQIFLGHQLGGGTTGQQNGTDHQVGLRNGLADVGRAGEQGSDLSGEDIIQVSQTTGAYIHNGDVGTHADGNLGCVGTDGTAAQNHHITALHAGHAAQQNAAAAIGLLQVLCAFLSGHTAGDLTHRSQAGQSAVTTHDGLVSDSSDLSIHQSLGQRGICSQMQVGIEDHTLAEILVLALDGLLNLNNHLSIPSALGIGNNHSTSLNIFFIGKTGANTSALLHQNSMAVLNVRTDCTGSQTHSKFVILNFLRQSNLHSSGLLSSKYP